jgi:hypothetical protein
LLYRGRVGFLDPGDDAARLRWPGLRVSPLAAQGVVRINPPLDLPVCAHLTVITTSQRAAELTCFSQSGVAFVRDLSVKPP